MKLVAPLDADTADNLSEFWKNIFGSETDPDVPKHVFTGSESMHNSNVVYLEKENGSIASTCGVTKPLKISSIGGFGEVATDPSFRKKGLATKLCEIAVNDFRKDGGEALFLGTGNPAAARIYHRLGLRKIPGTSVMVNITNGNSPEEYLVQRFSTFDEEDWSVDTATPAARIPIIPLLVNPHDWHVLDANIGMYSTRYDTQHSCMGLYRRYSYINMDSKGEWFTSSTKDGRIVGISSAKLINKDIGQIDGFTNLRFQNCWDQLMNEAIKWVSAKGVKRISSKISVEDEEKQAKFSQIGFSLSSKKGKFEYACREVDSLEFVMDVC